MQKRSLKTMEAITQCDLYPQKKEEYLGNAEDSVRQFNAIYRL